jgi:hypothetical protein
MKMTTIHYNELKSRIALVWTPEVHNAQRLFIINEGKAKDVEKRLRWDWSYYAETSHWICDNLYSYLDDSHLDTALKQIVHELTTTKGQAT